MNEQWRDISGYEGLYQVSDHGNVKSLTRTVSIAGYSRTIQGKQMRLNRMKSGYVAVSLWKDGIQRSCTVHRLVAEAFLPEFSRELDVHHKDGDRAHNAAHNLCSVSRFSHLSQHFTGEGNNRAKLTKAQVEEIRELVASGHAKKALAREFEVSRSAIQFIANGRNWSSINSEWHGA